MFNHRAAFFIGVMHALNKAELKAKILNPGVTVSYAPVSMFSKSSTIFSNRTSSAPVRKLSREETKYFVEVYITNTNQANGTGHVSASMIEDDQKETTLVKHVSYMPALGLSAVFAMACGFIPVAARNDEKIRNEDVLKSNTIIRVPLTCEQFQQALESQRELEGNCNDFSYLYAVTAEANLVALMLAKMAGYCKSHEMSVKNYIKDNGLHPQEDDMGIVVLSNYYHPESSAVSVVLNCTGAVQLVLEKSGLNIDDKYVLPASLGQAIINQCPGAEVVSKSLVNPIVNQEDVDDNKFSDNMTSYT